MPPKPKLLDNTFLISLHLAFKGTKSNPIVSLSGLTKLFVGGTVWFTIDNIEYIASIAPAAPNKWPVADLVELILVFCIFCLSSLLIAFSSITFLFYPRWIKFLYEKNEKIESFKLMTKQNEIVEILLGFLSVFGIMFIPLFIDYFLPQYSASILVAQLLLLAYMLNGMTFITSTFLIWL